MSGSARRFSASNSTWRYSPEAVRRRRLSRSTWPCSPTVCPRKRIARCASSGCMRSLRCVSTRASASWPSTRSTDSAIQRMREDASVTTTTSEEWRTSARRRSSPRRSTARDASARALLRCSRCRRQPSSVSSSKPITSEPTEAIVARRRALSARWDWRAVAVRIAPSRRAIAGLNCVSVIVRARYGSLRATTIVRRPSAEESLARCSTRRTVPPGSPMRCSSSSDPVSSAKALRPIATLAGFAGIAARGRGKALPHDCLHAHACAADALHQHLGLACAVGLAPRALGDREHAADHRDGGQQHRQDAPASLPAGVGHA